MTNQSKPIDEIFDKFFLASQSAGLRREAKEAIEAYVAEERRKARIDEILKIRAVGDAYAAGDDVDFEGLCAAYDAHILKRAADLTEPNHV